jgi:ABC-2 type transport system permease protein
MTNKLFLIFQREYLSRVTKRSFILATILTPLGIGLLSFVAGYLQMYDGDKLHRFLIVDEANFLHDTIGIKKDYIFDFSKKTIEEEKVALDKKKYDGIVYLKKNLDLTQKKIALNIFTDKKLSLDIRGVIEDLIEVRLESYKMASLGIDKAKLDALSVRVSLDTEAITAGNEEQSSLGSVLTTALGAIMGFIMYLTLFIYGMMVMRSVQEEKTNRIVEIMISSVRPFELMLGKILGVAAVALTQLVIWVVLGGLIMYGVTLLLGFTPEQSGGMAMNPAAQQAMEMGKNTDFSNIMTEVGKINWWFILPMFAFYFVCGYLLYSSLFAAVGSAVSDDSGESQSLTIPITVPIILAIYIMMHAVRQPDSTLSIFASIFPLFSPIVMPARLGFNPPMWQILVSALVLIGSTIFFIWLSGRIYRVGILLYGKKANLKEMLKWIFSND